MARFLFVAGEGGGNVPPTLAVIRDLVGAGHEVDFLGVPWIASQVDTPTVADSLRERASAAGARPVGFEQWHTGRAEHVEIPSFDELATFDNVITMSFFVAMSRWVGEAVDRQLGISTYDAVAIDVGAPTAAAATDAHGLPYAVLVHSIDITRWWPGRPCPGQGRRVGGTLEEERQLAAGMDRLIDETWLDPINGHRASLDLPPVEHTTDLHDRAAAVIVMSSKEFDTGSENAPSNHRYVGPCLVVGGGHDNSARPAAIDDDRPLVMMSPTTTTLAVGQVPFVRASIEALASLPVRGLVTVGRNLDPARFEAPDGVTVVGHADHSILLPRASALITHCGHGTVMTALRYGVPLVGVPDFADQRDIAARIADHHVGITMDKPASSADLADAVATVLADDGYKVAAARLAAALSQVDGPANAARVLVDCALAHK